VLCLPLGLQGSQGLDAAVLIGVNFWTRVAASFCYERRSEKGGYAPPSPGLSSKGQRLSKLDQAEICRGENYRGRDISGNPLIRGALWYSRFFRMFALQCRSSPPST
jgi:hypothetical protein